MTTLHNTTTDPDRATPAAPARGDALILGLAAEYYGCGIAGGEGPSEDDGLLMAILASSASGLPGIAIQAAAIDLIKDMGWPEEGRVKWTEIALDSIRDVLFRHTGIRELMHHTECWKRDIRPVYADPLDPPAAA
jgi:hypothetical protein